MMKQYSKVTTAAAAVLLGLTFILVLLAGWHKEMTSRFPVADMPFVDMDRLDEQIDKGNVSRREAIYYRKDYAGADTTEIR
jgi:hypothetical protein